MGRISNIVEFDIESIVPYDRNAKIHGEDQVRRIADSIKEFGFLAPCLIDRDGNLIAGHGRVEAAKLLGMHTVPCVYVEGLTDAQRRAYILADNRLGEMAEWDMDIVREELSEISEEGIDASLTGFDWDSTVNLADVKEDDFEVPEGVGSETEPTGSHGTIWQLGRHRLMCGDSADPDDMAALFGDERPVLVVTDPPYGVSIGSKNRELEEVTGAGGCVKEDIENDTLSEEDLYEVLVRCFGALRNHADEACSYYVFAPSGELQMMMMMMMRDAGLPVRHMLVWVKNVATFSLGRLDYDYRHEMIMYTWGARHNFRGGYDNSVIEDASSRIDNLSVGELKDLVHALRGDGATSTIYCDKPSRSELHPTMKPVKLVARLIYNSSEEGDVVADIFGGSGTTLIACEQLNRTCYMMEKDPHYCDVIIDRWQTLTGQEAMRL